MLGKGFKTIGIIMGKVLVDIWRFFERPTIVDLGKYTLFIVETLDKWSWKLFILDYDASEGACL